MTRSTEKQSAAISRRGRDCSTRRSAARRQSGHYHSWLHRVIVSRIFQVPEDDVFPTLYRANTMTALRQAMNDAGLTEREMDTINHYPAYLMFSPVLFRLGVIYERLTSLQAFRSLRGSILCVFEKQPEPRMSTPGILTTRNRVGVS